MPSHKGGFQELRTVDTMISGLSVTQLSLTMPALPVGVFKPVSSMQANTASYCSVLSHAYHPQFSTNQRSAAKRTCHSFFTFYHSHWQSPDANYIAVRVAFVTVLFWAICYIGGNEDINKTGCTDQSRWEQSSVRQI
jgi:hypothetical protein